MIVCPIDNLQLKKEDQLLSCPQCAYRAIKRRGNIYFHPDLDDTLINYNSKGLDILYKAEQEHFWFKNRKKIILNAFLKYSSKDEDIIEIGAGTGSVARMLMENGFKVAIGDIYSKGLEYAKTYGVDQRYQFDLLSSPFENHYDVIGMFDVLEHIEDEKLALKNMHKMLKVEGKIILTVPAHMWLWNRADRIAHHQRRYERKEIVDLFNNNGFEVIKANNFFISILPLLYIRTILNKDDGSLPKFDEYEQEIKMNKIINTILDITSSVENKVLERFNSNIGGSIILIAKKVMN